MIMAGIGACDAQESVPVHGSRLLLVCLRGPSAPLPHPRGGDETQDA